MSVAIDNLAHAADINYLVDPRVEKWWALPDADGQLAHEPVVTFRWTNLTAKDALSRLLEEHHLVLAEDPFTTVGRVTYAKQLVSMVDAGMLGGDTNEPVPIKFQDVPITVGLANLAQAAHMNYLLDPQISYGRAENGGQIQSEPTLSFDWNHVTPKQAFVAICENYGLAIFREPTSNILLVRAEGHSVTNFVDANLLGDDTNRIPLVEFRDIQPVELLKKLIQLAHINAALDSNVFGHFDPATKIFSSPSPTTVRWENITARQAIAALCENYDLVVTKDAAGVLQIKPGN